jgi:hypothetical protein
MKGAELFFFIFCVYRNGDLPLTPPTPNLKVEDALGAQGLTPAAFEIKKNNGDKTLMRVFYFRLLFSFLSFFLLLSPPHHKKVGKSSIIGIMSLPFAYNLLLTWNG